MATITQPGTYNVRIVDWFHKKLKFANDPKAFAVVLKGETADGNHIFGELIFSKMMYEGKTSSERAREVLIQLGVKDGYPGDIDDEIKRGMAAKFIAKKKHGSRGNFMQVSIYPAPTIMRGSDIDPDELRKCFDQAMGYDTAESADDTVQKENKTDSGASDLPSTGTADTPF